MLQVIKTSQWLQDPQSPTPALREAFEGAMEAKGLAAVVTAGAFVSLFRLDDWYPWLPAAYTLLDTPERRRVERRCVQSHRDQLALAYALHRLLLAHVLGCEAAEVALGRDALGCPRLSDGTLATSLSHTDGCVAVAVSAAGPVGVDIEPSTRATVMPDIADLVCHPVDVATMASLAGPELDQAMLALWVRKEAFLKAAGIGLQREMQGFAAPDRGRLALPDGRLILVRTLDAGRHWIAAVASAAETPVVHRWLRPANPAS